ncbi:MAG: hypothetical protein A2073_01795 [Deltaproteobacteria bacterium GWC2_42_11]|nr:MAG: hypothetical protein A2073_01795 [Deltaproteobacteria bacterium GWC2_42_11]
MCHNSLIVGTDGEVIANRTHDFGSRLWVRIFGLIYTHPQPKSGKTYLIKNKDGQSIPTTFAGEPASEYLIDKTQQVRRQNEMKKVCQSCHSKDLADKHFAKLDAAILETDRMTQAATQLVQKAWDAGLADRTNPFDEEIEQKWIKQWLFYANSIRFGTAMISYDYTTFEKGWWDSTTNLQEMHEWLMKRMK